MFFGEIRVFYNPNIIKKVNHSEIQQKSWPQTR